MVYEKTGKAQASDYNVLITEINKVFGIGTGNKGYGGFATGPGSKEPGFNAVSELPTKSIGSDITTRDWLNLRNTYEDCTRHQGTVLTVQQKGNIFNNVAVTTGEQVIIDSIIPGTNTVTFTSGVVSLTGTQIPPGAEYKTSDGISINGVPVAFVTGDVSVTGSIGATYITDDGITINGVPVNFTIGIATETGTVINPTTFGETLTINGTPISLANPTVVVTAGFNEFLGTVGEGEIVSITGVTVVDDAAAPITPVYTLFSGTMPTGLSINSSSGLISGTVTDGSVSADTIYNFIIDATDGTSVQQNFIIHVDCATFEAGVGISATGRTQTNTTTFVDALNLVYGIGSGTTGYGQTPFIAPTYNQEVGTADLFGWRSSISDMESHQGIVLAPTLPTNTLIQDPKPWSADIFYSGLLTNLNQIELNPVLVDAGSTVVSANPNGVNQTRVTVWSTSVQHQFTATFIDHDHARAFFNAGGQIRLAASRTGGSATTQNADWTTLLTNAGTVIFDATNYFALTTTFASIANTVGTGVYAANDWDVAVSSNSITDGSGRNGKGWILTFRSLYNDDHVASGAGPDSVDGTLTSDISMRNVNGSYLTITAPIFATTVVL